MAAIGLGLVQSTLIGRLLVQRAHRWRVEASLRESEQRFRVMAIDNQVLSGRLVKAQEMERMRIARELHDDVSQQLALVGIMLSGLRHKFRKPYLRSDVEQTIATLQDRASTLGETIRNLSHGLHPSLLRQVGLIATLRRHCVEVEQHHNVRVIFSAVGDLDPLTADQALCLFRVAQEALANAVRHARAQRVVVSLRATDEAVEMGVADDGIGFAAGECNGTGLGFRSMEDRVRLASGTVRVESQAGHGTRVTARISTGTGTTRSNPRDLNDPAAPLIDSTMPRRGDAESSGAEAIAAETVASGWKRLHRRGWDEAVRRHLACRLTLVAVAFVSW